jgi:hypothetical protein
LPDPNLRNSFSRAADAEKMSALLLAIVAFSLGSCLGASVLLLVTRRHGREPQDTVPSLGLQSPLPVRRLLLLTACSASASAVTVFYLSALH